jgi:hypothetical protein
MLHLTEDAPDNARAWWETRNRVFESNMPTSGFVKARFQLVLIVWPFAR